MITNCLECNKEFNVYPYQLKIGKGKYCSKKCYIKKWNKTIPGWNKGLKSYWMIGNQYRLNKTNKNPNKMFGSDNPRWIKDRTKLKGSDSIERRSSAYVTWRRNIYSRDNWKCKINNIDCNGRIEAHHILSFTKYPELRYNINNGITLCKFHHPRKRTDEIKMITLFKSLIN